MSFCFGLVLLLTFSWGVTGDAASCYGKCFAFYDEKDPKELLEDLNYTDEVLCHRNKMVVCGTDSKCTTARLSVSVNGSRWNIGSFQCQENNVTETSLCERLTSDAESGAMAINKCKVEFCHSNNCNDQWRSGAPGHTSSARYLTLLLAWVLLLGMLDVANNIL